MAPDRREGAPDRHPLRKSWIGSENTWRAGAEGLNIAFRAPIDWEAFEAYIENVLPVFHRPA